REQAARHLVAAPLASAAPAIASALSQEPDPKTRAQLAKALAACGGEGAAEMVAQLQSAPEPPLVRLAALEALCAIPSRAREALEIAARDETPAIRRRAAALAASAGVEELAEAEARGAIQSTVPSGGPTQKMSYSMRDLSSARAALNRVPPRRPLRRQLFLNFKGGTGKTSVSTSYAFRLAEMGHRVLVID